MAAFNFPNSPSTNDLHTENSVTWKWDGTVWKRQGVAGAQGAQGVQGAVGAQGHQGVQGAAGSATISNNADNRVITGGSGTNLNGEANLTFDGTDLTQTIGASNKGIKLTAAGNHYPSITFDANRSAENNGIMWLDGKWNGTSVGAISIEAGDDTTNKDDGKITFYTTQGGSMSRKMAIEQDGDVHIDNGNLVIGTTAAARSPLHIHRANADCYVHITNSTTGPGSGDGFTIQQSGVETLLNNRETGNMRLYTAGTERVRITAAGLMGLGTSSPGLKLHIQDGALSSAPTPNSNCDMVVEGTTSTGIQFLSSGQTQLRFGDAGSTAAGAIIYEHSGDNFKLNYSNSGALTFNDGSGENARFTPDGSLLIGSTAATFSSPVPSLDIEKSSTGTGPLIFLYNGQSANANSTCEIRVGQNYREANRIVFGRENSANWQSSNGSTASYIGFWTNSAGTIAERMRIDKDGHTLFGTTVKGTTSATQGAEISPYGYIVVRRNGNMSYWKTLDTGGYNTHVFLSANTTVGTIVVNSGGTAYNTSSDYRLKENVSGITDGIARVKQLKPSKFNWIADATNTPVDGFLAHEVSSLVPEAITGTKDAVAAEDDDEAGTKKDDPVYQQIDQSKLVPLLTAALQEEIAKREALEARVAALESS